MTPDAARDVLRRAFAATGEVPDAIAELLVELLTAPPAPPAPRGRR